LQKKRKKSRC